ncbi:MAG: porin [Archangium gephyra]|uniref:Porin n=1 Tax=Archangium gephyra TaxID=48 RepID=A0A2W5UXE7_9BACT|nr:MAG: porin [Archangium gephyra]
MQLLGLALILMASLPEPDGGVVTELPDAGVVNPIPVDVGVKLGEGLTVKVGEVKFQLRGRMQVQALSVIPGEASSAVRQNAIFVRRARVQLKGDLPYHLSFVLQLAFSPLDMEADQPNVLRDLYGVWAPFRDVSFRVGQMKVPFDVQRVVSSSSLQLVDRSIVTAELNLDRDVGLIVFSDDFLGLGQRLRYALGIFGGDGRNRIGTNVGLLYTARLRYAPFGAIDDRVEGDPDRDARPRLAFGVGAARNVATNRPRSTTGTPYALTSSLFSYTHATGDVHFKWYGVSLLSSVYFRQADLNAEGSGAQLASNSALVGGTMVTEYSRSGWGWFVQAGGYVTDWLELVARYGDVRPMGPSDPRFTRQREVGGGINLMFQKHDLKLQTDCFWLDDGAGNNGRVQLRLQAQLHF